MSKESYARGFCKAAEAAGIDPVALAKYAQHYNTEGWAPEPSQIKPSSGILGQTANGSSLSDAAKPDMSSIIETARPWPPDKNEILMRTLDPRRKAWNIATTNAAEKVLATLMRAGFKEGDKIQPQAMKFLEKIYHDSMSKSTGGVSRVSAPAKK